MKASQLSPARGFDSESEIRSDLWWKDGHEISRQQTQFSERQRGFGICLEGPDKCGKSTQVRMLAHWLESNGFEFLVLDRKLTHVGRFIREINTKEIPLPPSAKTLLYAVDFTMLTPFIGPTLDRGVIVVYDRWVHSALAYGGALGLSTGWIEEVHRHIPMPDLVLVIDAPPEVALDRLKASGDWAGYYDSGYNSDNATREQSFLEFQAKVRDHYHLLAEMHPNVILVDSTASKEDVHLSVRKLLLDSLRDRNILVRVSA